MQAAASPGRGTGVKYPDANQFCFLIFAASKTGKETRLLKIS